MNIDSEYILYTMSMTRIKTDKSIIFIDIVVRTGTYPGQKLARY